jgi:sRNA-binding protein
MTSPYRIERDRGIKDSSKQLAMLQERWPLAFPLKLDDVRPLAEGASREIAAATGWSLPYTLGVLGSWKLAAFYCRAILAHDQRITLDGTPAETVNAEAKDLASKRLAELTSHGAPKRERERGTKDSSKQLVVLQEKWPLAFPLKLIDVRPLAQGAGREIATAMGWSMPYTLGVLSGWTSAAFYCRAVLAHDQCITLDGAPAEPVDAKAKELATKRLAEVEARKAVPKLERDRGTKDSSKQLVVLQEKWPLAFPLKLIDVRPLAESASREIAAAMGWSMPDTLGVLDGWKLAAFYCRAVLAHDQCITLDGAPAGPVDTEAKDLATKRLAEIMGRKAANKPGPKPAGATAEQAPKQAVTAPEPVLEKPPEKPKPAAETAKPKKGAAAAKPVAKPKPAPQKAPPPAAAKPAPAPPVEPLPETPEQLRARVRAALLRRSA